MKPFLRYVGGKRRLAPIISAYLPMAFGTYHEPFLGSGALFGYLASAGRITRGAVLSDVNPDLAATFWTIAHDPEALLRRLKSYGSRYEKARGALYARERDAWNRGERFPARFLFLAGSSFNALWRVSRAGKMNTPWGKHARFGVDEALIRQWSSTLLSTGAFIRAGDYRETVWPEGGDLVYVDPPYVGTFDSYAQKRFSLEEHAALVAWCSVLHRRGVHVALSNSLGAWPFVESLWPAAQRHVLDTRYLVSCDGQKRPPVRELLAVGIAR